ncbi:MAG: hypothetical protein ACK4IK_10590 [Bacteroidia bacterium]
MKFKKLILFIKLLIVFTTKAQIAFFENYYGDLLPDLSRNVIQDADKNMYLLGTTVFNNNAQVNLTKCDSSGNLIWTKYYGDTLNDFGISMVFKNNKITFVYEKYNSISDIGIGIIKVDTSGSIIWQNQINKIQNLSPRQIIYSLDNQYLICGFISDNFNSNNIYIAKLDTLGNLIWDNSIGGTDNDYSSGIIQMSDSTIYVSGDTRSFSVGGYDVYLIKLDKNGNLLWDRNYGNQYDNGSQGVLLTQNQKIFVFGETHTGIGLDFDYYTLMVDSSGNQLWQYNLGWSGTDAAFSAIEDIDGNFILTGYSNSNDTTMPINLSVFKINQSGTVLWQRFYGGSGIDIGFQIIPSQSGGLLITGQSYIEGFDTQQYLLHLTSNGLLSQIKLQDAEFLNNIYPNPFCDSFYLKNFNIDASYKLYSFSGEIIPIEIRENQIIPQKTLTSSVYILMELLSNGDYKTYKIVKH